MRNLAILCELIVAICQSKGYCGVNYDRVAAVRNMLIDYWLRSNLDKLYIIKK